MIDIQVLDEVIVEGRLAYHDGAKLTDNPYTNWPSLYAKWEEGWKMGVSDAPIR